MSQLAVVASALTSDARQAATLSRNAGFDGLLFDAFSRELNIPDLSSTGVREFRHLLASQNQQLVGLRVDLGPSGFGPGADVDRALSQLDRVMDTTARAGAPLVCVELGPLPAESDAGFISQLDAALVDLGVRADRYNVIIAFRSELASFAALHRAVSAARCPWFGFDLDPVAILRDAWPLSEIFSKIGPQIRHVRGRDALRGSDRRTKPTVIGHGSTDWIELLAHLDAAGFHGWITVDPMELRDRPAGAMEGMRALRAKSQ